MGDEKRSDGRRKDRVEDEKIEWKMERSDEKWKDQMEEEKIE